MAVKTPVLINAAGTIRKLAEMRLDDPTFVTVYVNLDPSQFGTAPERDAQFDSLLHDLRANQGEDGTSHDAANALAADIERIDGWLHEELDASGIQGLALFCASSAGVFESVGLSAPVGPSVHVGPTAHLAPLISVLPTKSWCVLLTNRRTARIFRGNRDRLHEIESITDDVHGQHEQGGWSQRRYERSVENEVMDHVQNACDLLFDELKNRPFDKLLLGCPQEMRPDVESKMHAYLTERLVDHFETEVEHISEADVSERVRSLIETDESRTESELIERLAEQLGRRERAVAGVRPVLDTLNQRAVETLLFAPGFEAPGAACPQCGFLSMSGGDCPIDRTVLEQVENLLEPMTRSVILQSADVHEVRYHEPESALSAPVAALLRFDVAG